jgi:diaminopimelate decarboxylase
MDNIEGVSVEKLVNDFGSPLFIVSAKTIRDNLKRFRSEFSTRYPKVEVAYSYKVNCLSGVLNIIHNEGAWAEVASGFEYELARLEFLVNPLFLTVPTRKKRK